MLGALTISWLWRRRLWPFFFACAYFVTLLFPILGYFKVYFFRYSFVGDHFQYLASIGPVVLAGVGITGLFRFLCGKSQRVLAASARRRSASGSVCADLA